MTEQNRGQGISDSLLPSAPEDGVSAPAEPSGPPRRLDELQARWQVREHPFVSRVPLIGPWIARLREMWNSVSTKWYVRPLLQQQNHYNQLVAAQLADDDRRLFEQTQRENEIDQRLILQDRELMVMVRELSETRYRLLQLEKRLESLQRSDLGQPEK